jgi:hypothetical protein
MARRTWALVVALGLLSGCGIAAKVQARDDMERAKVAYTRGLAQNSADPAVCRGLGMAYQADMQAYRATTAGIQPGRNNTLNVNTHND